MIGDMVDLLFGCWHRNTSFPRTPVGRDRWQRPAAQLTGSYVVCLDCGREFAYDLAQMCVLSAHSARARQRALEADRV